MTSEAEPPLAAPRKETAGATVALPLRHAARGGLWLGAGQTLGTAANWLTMLVLARLLSPESFGIVGMATVILGFVATFSDLGLTAALIQRAELEPAHKDAAFWSSVAMGLVLFLILLGLAPILATLYREPRVTGVVVAASLSLLIGPLSSTHRALLRRELRFATVAKLETLRNVSSSAASIVGALWGLGYWALPLGPIVGLVVSSPAYFLAERTWRPAFRGSLGHAKDLLSFSMYVALGSGINYISANVDYLIIGRVLGAGPLGVYTLAYQIVTLPLQRISFLFSQVLFPVFSGAQKDLEQTREAYLLATRSLALITFPLLAWVGVVAPELLLVVLGEKWLDAVPLVRLLCVAGAVKSVGTLVGIVFRSQGRSDVEFYWNVFWAAAVSVAVLVGVVWGAAGVALSISLVNVPAVLYTESLACRYLKLPYGRLLGALVLPLAGASVLALVGTALRVPLENTTPGVAAALTRLTVLSVCSLGSAAAALRLFNPNLTAEVRSFLRYFRKSP